MKLQTKISIYLGGGLLVIGLLVAAIVGSMTGKAITKLANEQITERVIQLTDLIDAYRQQSERLASDQLTAFANTVAGEWRRNDAEPLDTAGLTLPALKLNGRTVNNDFSLPDQFTKSYGSVATLFVRSKDDFFRVTTSLKKEDGKRAIGTALGSGHPAFALLSKGESYVGKARLFGRDYMTKYQAIKNDQGEVIGALFIGVDFTESLKGLKDSIRAARVGNSGYIYAVDVGTSKARGDFVIHPSLEGKSAFELKDTKTGDNFLKTAAELKNGIVEYTWDDVAKGIVTKYSVFSTYEPWALQFHVSVYASEYLAPAKESAISIAVAMSIAAILMAIAAIIMVRQLILVPLGGEPSLAVAISASIAAGNLTHPISAAPGSLLGSLDLMQKSLRTVISEVIKSSQEIAQRSEELATSSQEIGRSSHSQAESTSASAASIEQLTVSIDEVSHIAESTERNSVRVSEISERGVSLVRGAANEISSVQTSVAATSKQIRVLQERSREIGSIANVIKEIADQTNLLALNAAIEAARAGEQGRGFAVVADEVRKLAERTSVATTDIATMIDAIQQENEQAVIEMDKVGPQVEKSIEISREAAKALEEIHKQALDSLAQVRDVSYATTQQVTAATDIAQHMERIASMSEQTNATMQQSVNAAMELDRIATGLKEHVSRFTV